MLLVPFSKISCETGKLSRVLSVHQTKFNKADFSLRCCTTYAFDDLSIRLKTAKRGCHIAGECLNHMLYVDGMALLALFIKSL